MSRSSTFLTDFSPFLTAHQLTEHTFFEVKNNFSHWFFAFSHCPPANWAHVFCAIFFIGESDNFFLFIFLFHRNRNGRFTLWHTTFLSENGYDAPLLRYSPGSISAFVQQKVINNQIYDHIYDHSIWSLLNRFYVVIYSEIVTILSSSMVRIFLLPPPVHFWVGHGYLERIRAPLGRSKYGKNRPHSAKIFTNFVIAPERLGAGVLFLHQRICLV